MKIHSTEIEDVLLIEPSVFLDGRGYFFESYNQKIWQQSNLPYNFVQDNESHSKKGTLRGLHYQLPPFAQAKLVRVVKGAVLDVAVDIREGSQTYGQYVARELSAENKLQLLIPSGFAHGFLVLSDDAVFSYKCDNYYSKSEEGGICFDDVSLNIDWGIEHTEILVSDKDKIMPSFGNHRKFIR